MLGPIRCVFILTFLIITSGVTYSQETMIPLRKNPIDLVDDRAPSGKPFTLTITLPKKTGTEKISVKIYFTAGENRIPTSGHVDKEEPKGNQVVYTIKAMVPKYEDIFKGVKREWYEGWWSTRRAQVEIHARNAQDTYERFFSFAIPLRKTATLWGIIVVLLFLVIIALMKPDPFPTDKRFDGGAKDKRAEKWKDQHPFSRLLLYPLNFAVTPIGNYSISVAQILFWTAIVIFASIYVFLLRGEFLNVSDQVLTLLGISGGTAVAAKASAVVRSHDIPIEFLKGIERTRIPRVRDLICIGGIPNIFKFQIFAFTLINGALVLKQLYAHFNFPDIPTGQLILMGISSTIYLGNEITMENIWKMIEEKTKQFKEAMDRKDTAAYDNLKEEITNLLKSIYSAI